MKLIIITHGALRDYFEPVLVREIAQNARENEIKNILKTENPMAGTLIDSSRLADDEKILSESEILVENIEYHLMPPPGGG